MSRHTGGGGSGRRAVGRAALAALVLLLAGCGVPVEDTPRTVPAPRGPFPSAATGEATSPAGRVAEVLCFVRDDRLVPVERRLDAAPTADAQLAHLLAGPSAAERDRGLTSSLPGAVGGATVRITGAHAEVDVGAVDDEAGRSDEVLAFGQLVCTLTARTDVETVSFLRRGQPLGVPRADGSLSRQPLSAADYTDLITPG
ncbi:GerMN domain-containing protein [Micromonospora sp. C28SCA-DRY-2]|uniref:GerMN domain-containing protein n=1 Tax=Micromonospora sp. C28SCA-DRY-2 TaxID=3059522 RepID=UPI002675DFC1|nr:GerMN domain-containing protein [Micromonospora sp. C28SCA-DRY-2]MDO3702982.1 GerMN domain-containing protein [Micromonospora sp. C28SCA-DRY-2]